LHIFGGFIDNGHDETSPESFSLATRVIQMPAHNCTADYPGVLILAEDYAFFVM
jgi:hypothetical protein